MNKFVQVFISDKEPKLAGGADIYYNRTNNVLYVRNTENDQWIIPSSSEIDEDYITQLVSNAINSHSNDSTNVHGISNTSLIVYTSDPRLSDARTPLSHSSTHSSTGSDPVSIVKSQITDFSHSSSHGSGGSDAITISKNQISDFSHASTHGSAGSDAITIAKSQVSDFNHASSHGSSGSDAITISKSQVSDFSHSSSHGSGGSDAITIAKSQVTDLQADLTAGNLMTVQLERSGGYTAGAGQLAAFGNGSADGYMIFPFDVDLMYAAMKVNAVHTGITTVQLTIDGTSQGSVYELSCSGAGSTSIKNLTSTPKRITAGQGFNFVCISTSGTLGTTVINAIFAKV